MPDRRGERRRDDSPDGNSPGSPRRVRDPREDRDRDRARERNRDAEREKRPDREKARSRERNRSRDRDRDGNRQKGDHQPRRREDKKYRDDGYEKRRSRSPWGRHPRDKHDSPDEHRLSKRHRNDKDEPRSSKSSKRRRDSYSASPPPHRPTTKLKSASPEPFKRSKAPLPSQNEAYNGTSPDLVIASTDTPTEKKKPNFAPSGKLAAETNTVAGTTIILKYNEPPEARLPPPSQAWRLYVFKGSETLESISLHTRSCWLFGRERAVADFPIDHPSCSKQHAVIQFRFVEKKDEFGDRRGGVKPYVLDLESANGTRVNGVGVEARRYLELRSGDVITFGESTREYVFMLPPAD
ncbi:MAG: hypothetical protein MMC33_010290 [Icmadophila ericetorum]|nr:hypothetical protein [Icmadophila ericetorum]